MNKPIFFHVYCSKATEAFSEAALLELLTGARENNARLGLSGMLLYKDGNFMQVLEGEESTVRSLLRKIQDDRRHQNVVQVLAGFTTERQFPYWYMGFQNLDSEAAQMTPGYSEFLNTPLTVGLAADPTLCQRLLHLFKKGVRLPGQALTAAA
jgi:hypothetical protein